jgi:uncharacterized protein
VKILIDINHVAHLNFFRPVIRQLQKDNNTIVITYLQRGKLQRILDKELPEITKYASGAHHGTRMSIIFQANIVKFFKQFFFILKNNFDIGLSCGGFVNGAAFKLLMKPNIQFDDDPERKKNVMLEKITATKLVFPPIISTNNNKIITYNALKEWSYLSPSYFSPDEKILKGLGLEPKKYIFVREISSGSMNYMSQPHNIILSVAGEIGLHNKVILSLEDKTRKELYPPEWILLQEPVGDIHSLIYFSKMMVSSGDSMAREGALLGVPSVYCGTRVMKANQLLINRKRLFHINIAEVPELIRKINREYNSVWQDQDLFRQDLLKEWDDVPGFICGLINTFKK